MLGHPLATAETLTTGVVIQTPPSLTSGWSVAESPLSVGQIATAVLTITNTGQATADSVSPTSAPGLSTLGVILTQVGPAIVGTTLTAGSSVSFVYTFSANAAGTLNLTAAAYGTDGNTALGVTSAVASYSNLTVQNKALLSTNLFVSPLSNEVGGTFTALMTVSNAVGSAVANGVLPFSNPGIVGAGSPLSLLTGPLPATSQTIAAGGSVIFTYTYSAAGVANPINLTDAASGTDGDSGLAALSLSDTSNTFQVVSNFPNLVGTWLPSSPTVATAGQSVTAFFQVQDTNLIVGASGVSPTGNPLLTTTATFNQLSGPQPASTNLAPGGTTVFTYVYNFNTASTATAIFTAEAVASSGPPSAAASSSPVTIQAPSNLAVTAVTLSPLTISSGQTVTMQVTVSNVGVATANDVSPTVFNKIGTANQPVLGVPVPVSVTLASGQSQTYLYSFAATGSNFGPWNLQMQVGASGLDANSGQVQSGGALATSNAITIDAPAALSAGLTVPSLEDLGNTFTVTMSVQNTGGTTANSVVPGSLSIIGTGGAIVVAPVAPANANIAAGVTDFFTYTFSAAGSGTISFQGQASGTDSNSGLGIASSLTQSTIVTIESAANLQTQSLVASPSTVGTGADITVIYTVANTGQTTANNVSPVVGATVPSTVAYLSGPVPAVVNLPGSTPQSFTYIYQAITGTSTAFTATAYGTDISTLLNVTTTPLATSNLVNISLTANLGVAFFVVSPSATASVGQILTVLETVSDTGLGNANGVEASGLTPTGNASVFFVQETPIAGVTLSPGQTQVFTFTYTATGAGLVSFSGNASGFDVLGHPLATAETLTTGVVIQTPPSLTSGWSVAESPLSVGQIATAVLTITNTGQATADSVSPTSAPGLSTLGVILTQVGPAIVGTTLTAGSSVSFVYTFSANAAGTLNLTAAAYGTDGNTALGVTSAVASYSNLTVQNKALLSTNLFVSPLSNEVGGTFTALMTVSNAVGSAVANGVLPFSNPGIVGAGSPLSLLTGPLPATSQTIAAGGSVIFTYTYSAAGVANPINLTDAASGTDGDSGLAALSLSDTSNTSKWFRTSRTWWARGCPLHRRWRRRGRA